MIIHEKYSVHDIHKLVTENQNLIKYNQYALSPSCFGVSAYIYSINTNNLVNIECEIRDKAEPDLSKNYEFKYCSLVLRQNNQTVYRETNTKDSQDIYAYMNQLYKERHR